jgi:hypothetical protein
VSIRDQVDQTAWATPAARTPFAGKPEGYACACRPANFEELALAVIEYNSYEHGWSEFLHGFYRCKIPDFFAIEPPDEFSVEGRVAGRRGRSSLDAVRTAGA